MTSTNVQPLSLSAPLPPVRAIDLVDPSATSAGPGAWFIAGAAVLALALVAAAYIIWRAAEPEPPVDRAYRTLARGLGLRRRDRRLLDRLAAEHGEATPVALLLSEHAFRTAMDALWRTPGTESLRADAGRLLNRVHGAGPAGAS